jgi:hypothetical protein
MDTTEMARKGSNNNGNGNGNDDNGGEPVPTRGRRITADDLSKAAEAAREAAAAASTAAEAVVVALESGDVDESLVGLEGEGPQVSSRDVGGGRDAEQGGEGRVAFEQFMAQLSGVLKRAGNTVDVTENARWVKIESKKNGHKIYVAKGKTQVNRIESTLPVDLVPGAEEPDRKNGRIASYLPADPKVVSDAIRHLAQSEEQLRPPLRGGGQGQQGGGQQGGGGRRQQAKFN